MKGNKTGAFLPELQIWNNKILIVGDSGIGFDVMIGLAVNNFYDIEMMAGDARG